MTGSTDLPPILDLEAVPADLLVTEAKLREIAGDEPGILNRYLDLLSVPPDERCASAARGAGGLYWPCVRPMSSGSRHCFAHTDVGGTERPRGIRRFLRRG